MRMRFQMLGPRLARGAPALELVPLALDAGEEAAEARKCQQGEGEGGRDAILLTLPVVEGAGARW